MITKRCLDKFVEYGARSVYDAITKMAFGTGTREEKLTDESLENEIYRKEIAGKIYYSDRIEITAVLMENEVNGYEIKEVGLFDNDGNMYARKLCIPIYKDESKRVWFVYTINYAGGVI